MSKNNFHPQSIDTEAFIKRIKLSYLISSDFIDNVDIALSHPSYINRLTCNSSEEKKELINQFRRFALLGDALVRAIVMDYLFHHNETANLDQGKLSKFRDEIVSGQMLSVCGRDLRIGDFARLGEEIDKSKISTKIMSSMVEALVTAVYLVYDRDMEQLRDWFCEIFLENWVDIYVYSNLNPYGDEHLISDQEHLYMMGFDSDLGGFIPGDD
jgi:dsRNA-specific ribonuclease